MSRMVWWFFAFPLGYLAGTFVTRRLAAPIVCGNCGRVTRRKHYKRWLDGLRKP